MKYRISDNSDSPAYLQLYRQLKQDIVDTVYAYGCKLPSKRLMAEDLGISTVTVEHAYYLLCDEGYVESRERSGYFVIFRTNDGFAASSNEHKLPAATVNNTHGTEPTFPFSVLEKTMRRVLSIHGEAMLDRSPSKGLSELRTVICEYLARNRGINASPEQIIVGSGAEYLYGLIVELLGRDKIYGIESPSYHKIEQVYRTKDVKYEFLHLGSDGISSTDLCLTSANVLHTTPFRSYPTGVTASASKLHEYILWSGKGERYIIEDDFESEFSVSSKPTDTLFAQSRLDNVIYLNTFSKTVSPSLRLGYMVLPMHLTPMFDEKLGFYSCTVPTFEQYVLTELISNGDFERHVNRVRRMKRQEMK